MTILTSQTRDTVGALVHKITDMVYIKFMHHLEISHVSLAVVMLTVLLTK